MRQFTLAHFLLYAGRVLSYSYSKSVTNSTSSQFKMGEKLWSNSVTEGHGQYKKHPLRIVQNWSFCSDEIPLRKNNKNTLCFICIWLMYCGGLLWLFHLHLSLLINFRPSLEFECVIRSDIRNVMVSEGKKADKNRLMSSKLHSKKSRASIIETDSRLSNQSDLRIQCQSDIVWFNERFIF